MPLPRTDALTGTGAQAITDFLAAGTKLGAGRPRRSVVRLRVDPGRVGTGITVEFTVDGTVVERVSAPVAGGSLCIEPIGLDNKGAPDKPIKYEVFAVVGTETWLVRGEYTEGNA